ESNRVPLTSIVRTSNSDILRSSRGPPTIAPTVTATSARVPRIQRSLRILRAPHGATGERRIQLHGGPIQIAGPQHEADITGAQLRADPIENLGARRQIVRLRAGSLRRG